MDSGRFSRISRAYALRDRESLREGKLPLRETSKGFWHPAIAKEAFLAFQKLGLSRYKRFLDLGSGDGRVVLIASLFVPRAEGVEIDPELHGIALGTANQLKSNALFHHGDLYSHDLSPYDILFLYPDTPLERGMEQKLLKEMKGDLILFGNHFHPRFLKKKQAIEVDGTSVTLYSWT
jgi:SAM-dependent methyltransferase